MIVVADTSPINILARIGLIDLLPTLYGSVVIPPEVEAELTHASTPPIVRSVIEGQQAWLTVRAPHANLALPELDPGERAAISLAVEIKADLVLMDESKGRIAARAHHLEVTGALGVLERSAEQGLIDLPAVIHAIQATNFRLSDELIEAALRRDAERQRTSGRPPKTNGNGGSNAR